MQRFIFHMYSNLLSRQGFHKYFVIAQCSLQGSGPSGSQVVDKINFLAGVEFIGLQGQ